MFDIPWFTVAVAAIAGLSLVAYAVGALDLLGAMASFFLGLLIATMGELRWVLLMVTFTGLGVVATRIGYRRKQERNAAEAADGTRGVRNVMGNGAAAGLMVMAGHVQIHVPLLAVQLAYASAVAAVAADTMASELGALSARARRILPPFAPARVGDNGAVSLAGHAAAAAGALLIAFTAVFAVRLPVHLVWIPAVAGFLGCQLDSILGALLEGEGDAAARGRRRPLGKQDVNFLASFIPAAVVLILAILL